MKKILIFTLLLLLILPAGLAIDLEVETKSSDQVMIKGLNTPAIFDVEITNLGTTDFFNFYTFFGSGMEPKEKIKINSGETKQIEIKIYPRNDLNQLGFYAFNYLIKASDDSEQTQQLLVNIVELKDAFEVGSNEIVPQSNSIKIYLKNKENFEFQKISAKFSSAFFYVEEEFSIGPNQAKEFTIQLNKEDFNKLLAGFYTLNADISIDNEKAKIGGIIKFTEEKIVTTTEKDYGWFVNTKIIKKENKGNVIADIETKLTKNILSRLFTTFSPKPDIVERKGFNIFYTWNNQIKPGGELKITINTNWLFPFLIILFIIIVVILVKKYSNTSLKLRKKVSFIKTKGGEFALKVSINVNTQKYVEKVSVIDKLPPLVKLYEKFGREKPSRINEKSRKIEWNFEKLEAGEIRVINYVIYSKIGVLGRFALPSAVAIFEKDGKIKETSSNKAFFVSAQREKDIED